MQTKTVLRPEIAALTKEENPREFILKANDIATRLQHDLSRDEIYFMLGLSCGLLMKHVVEKSKRDEAQP